MSVYSYFLGVIVACISYLVYQRYVSLYPSIISKPEKRYDYIIVGAGTSGCVLAARLSEDPTVQVLLVEAGSQMGYFSKIPLAPTASQQGPDDWSVRTKPQKYSSFGLWDQSQIIPRGKGLGGSGQINFLLHGFGLPEDYERWSARGFKGWGIEDLQPYFMKAFGTTRSEFDSGHCSMDGYCPGDAAPMKLKLVDEQNQLLKTFQRASTMLKNRHTILRRATATVKDGVRFSTVDGYLKAALTRRNLHVVLKTAAVSIRFDNSTASSLFILRNNRELDNVFVNKEIILCAGAVKTPQILMMSGIGPREVIQRLRLKLISENRAVGRNLHDHMNMPVFVSIKKPISVTLPKVFTFGTVWDYLTNGRGLSRFPPLASTGFPQLSVHLVGSLPTLRLPVRSPIYCFQVFRAAFPFHNDASQEGFMFLATCTQPRSRGSVTLSDVSTNVPPVVDPNYLYDGYDVKCMIKAIRRAEQLVASPPFQDIGARIHWPRPERCLSLWNYTAADQFGREHKRRRKIKRLLPNQLPQKEKKTEEHKTKKPQRPPDEYLGCVLREVAVTGHHIGGTAAGGTVVDDELRVKSVSGLRVMDASIIPSPLSLYPNSVLVAMAEKAADIIKQANYLKQM
ncbi:neither inactivation nor afterpotential protein G [Choristoneura fumiferana]|uniref:neither inactivation nor afterpotential protein G n=1 Tax=Choristoneura fumiferana TaxID=7141 RepID=UPI003D15821B